MKKEKLNIVSLKVESFVTETSSRILGGADASTDVQGTCGYFTTKPKTCMESINWCWTP